MYEVSGLVMGGWEENTVPVDVPRDFGHDLYTPNLDRFEQHLEKATKRVPLLAETPIKTIINGPFPVSADGEPILGRAPNVENVYVGAGVSAGNFRLSVYLIFRYWIRWRLRKSSC